MQVLEEFRLRTTQLTTTRSGLNNSSSDHQVEEEIVSTDLDKIGEKGVNVRDNLEEEDWNCLTPKSTGSILKSTMVCPPAPKKPRPPRRKLSFPSSQGFFEVPDQDLTSLFMDPLMPRSKKIRAI